MIKYTLAHKSELEAIATLLKTNNLPYSDILESSIEFIVAKNQNDIIGCIGIERYEKDGLLRSFAVEPNFQNKGIGKELYKQLLHYAANNNIKTLHLLTTTAKDYFSKNGFSLATRSNVPGEISKSTEFAGLCPASSTYMVLDRISEYAG